MWLPRSSLEPSRASWNGACLIKNFIAAEDLSRIETETSRRVSGKSGKYPVRLLRLDGGTHNVVIIANPHFDVDGTFQGAFAFVWDTENPVEPDVE